MDKLLLGDAERYTRAHRRKRRWYQVTTCLAAVVVFCTTYALILPAITLEKQCEIPEHTHTEDCYTSEQGDLICTQSTEPQHTHTEECYQETQALVCGMEESTGHTHGAECYDQEGNLICGQEESEGHVHGEACYEASQQLVCGQTEEPAHQHTEECYSWNQVLTCGMEEHTHSEACTATEPEEPEEPEEPVFCGKEPHTHGDDCRDEQGELTCTLEEHTHSLACYADPTADVETAEIWEQTFGDVTLTGDWRQDTLAIAETQLGYAESTKNYVVAEDGQTLMGYTRYGAWQGDPYGDWNAMFVAFCLHYGGAENIPMDKDCGSWAAALADAFLPAQSHEAAPGDLVFFDRDGDGTADRVAIVAEVTEGGFTAIEGDVDHAVGQRAYEAADSAILGYVVLPQGPKEFTLTAQSESGITVTVTGDSASLPFPASEITLTAADVAEEQGQAIREQLPAEEDTEPEQRFLLDISLRHGEEEIEPVGPVTVTFSGLDTEGLYPKVYHIDTEAQEVTDMEAIKDEAGDITMSTDHFSTYDISLRAAKDIDGSQLGSIASGGSFRLTSGADWNEPITITEDTVLDLNGFGVCYQGTGSFLVVSSDATLTIMDSKPPEEKPVTPGDGSDLYGNAASLTFADNGSQPSMLTYYVTESSPSDTGTSETLKKYEVTPKGFIVGTATGTIVTVNSGGTFHLDGGLLTRKSSGDGHIISNNGTLNLTGGYVAGGNSSGWGGGVYSNGTVSMTGGVIAANSGTNGGGMFLDGGSFTMDGGIISGNQTKGGASTGNWETGLGGGVFAQNTNVTISNGYITNNQAALKCEQDGWGCHGGGGIATMGGSLTMEGGFVTGNYSEEAGGGMYIGHFNQGRPVTFEMSGGIVARNVANTSEGGGIRVSGGTSGSIRASDRVYITNNATNTTFDWGGGGIFVQEDGILTVVKALITDNEAGGFGGGVGACPTGKTLIVNEQGAAIYGNSAKGENMSKGGGNKIYDDVAQGDPIFTQNGYKDYFCVRDSNGANEPISLVTGQMAGGGAANWTGSCDDHKVSIGKTGYAAANYRFGLDAKPSQEDIAKAATATNVIITGNHSNIHGGGIMTNGGLILGVAERGVETEAKPELDITGTKALLMDDVPQTSDLNFQFQLRDKPLSDNTGTVVGRATANGTPGEFTFSGIEFEHEGTYTYYLSEVNDNQTGVTYDPKEYTIKVTVDKKSFTLLEVPFISYYVKSVTVDGKEVGGSSGSGSGTGPQTGPFRVRYRNTNGWDNVNVYVWEVTNDGTKNIAGGWPGTAMTKDTDGTWYHDLTVTGTGRYNYIFSKNGNSQTGDITNVPYAPGGEAVFDANGKVISNTAKTSSTETGGVSRGANADGSYTLVMDAPTFKNTMTTPLNLQITKTDSVNAEIKLEGATFTLQERGKETSLEVATRKDGIATFENIQRGATYYLREKTAPSGYMTAGPWILEVGADGNATLYPATEGPEGTLVKSGEPETPLTATDTDPKVLPVNVRDISWGYELPDTGGAGTTSYTAGGLTLTFGAATLLYIHCKRRKEDEVSS